MNLRKPPQDMLRTSEDKSAIRYTLPQSDYGVYWREWRRQFSKRKARIRSACTQLVGIKEFSLAKGVPDHELGLVVASRWFQEREFDKFLLWNGQRILRKSK